MFHLCPALLTPFGVPQHCAAHALMSICAFIFEKKAVGTTNCTRNHVTAVFSLQARLKLRRRRSVHFRFSTHSLLLCWPFWPFEPIRDCRVFTFLPTAQRLVPCPIQVVREQLVRDTKRRRKNSSPPPTIVGCREVKPPVTDRAVCTAGPSSPRCDLHVI